MHVLATGCSGFFGRHMIKLYKKEVFVIGRQNSDILCDLSAQIPKIPICKVVIHAAGKAHSIPKTEEEKQSFFDVNVKGTENLLKGLEQASSLPKSFIFISSVSVYGAESGNNISENYPLNAKDPYGLSKIQAEKIVQDWCAKNNVICGILRLPLLVGANPPGNLGVMIKGVRKGYYFNIAGGKAKKSMVMAEDVANIIPRLAELGGVYNLTDGYHPNFSELSFHIAKQLSKNHVYNMPFLVAKILAKIGDMVNIFPLNTKKLLKITADLTFDDSKARKMLDWKPDRVLDKFKIR